MGKPAMFQRTTTDIDTSAGHITYFSRTVPEDIEGDSNKLDSSLLELEL